MRSRLRFMPDRDVCVLSAARTPVGHFRGVLSAFDAGILTTLLYAMAVEQCL